MAYNQLSYTSFLSYYCCLCSSGMLSCFGSELFIVHKSSFVVQTINTLYNWYYFLVICCIRAISKTLWFFSRSCKNFIWNYFALLGHKIVALLDLMNPPVRYFVKINHCPHNMSVAWFFLEQKTTTRNTMF